MIRNLFFVFVIGLFTPVVFAAQIAKIKGKSVLIDLAGTAAKPGDAFYALSSDGGRKALIRISKIKGDKAIGKIIKGRPAQGMALELRTKSASVAYKNNPYNAENKNRAYWGGLFGYSRDSMNVDINNSLSGQFLQTVNMTGSGFSGKALLDYELVPQVWFRGSSGLEMFNVSGGSVCGESNAQSCDAKIIYMTFDFLGRYVFKQGRLSPWLGAGVSLLFPATKSTTALSEASVTTTSVFNIAGGADIVMSQKMYIPLQIEYSIFPKSDEVSASAITFRVGAAFAF